MPHVTAISTVATARGVPVSLVPVGVSMTPWSARPLQASHLQEPGELCASIQPVEQLEQTVEAWTGLPELGSMARS